MFSFGGLFFREKIIVLDIQRTSHSIAAIVHCTRFDLKAAAFGPHSQNLLHLNQETSQKHPLEYRKPNTLCTTEKMLPFFFFKLQSL